MKQLVLLLRDEVICALSGRGQFQLDREYAGTDPSNYFKDPLHPRHTQILLSIAFQ